MKINETESSDDYFCDEKQLNIPAEAMQGNPLDILLYLEETADSDDDDDIWQSNEYIEALRQK
jgi:hypothetical protein